MYHALNPALMFTALAIPFVCLCRNVRQRLWPVICSLLCGGGFLILQIVVLVLRVKWAGEYGLPQLTDSILRLSVLFLIGVVLTIGFYLCAAFWREEESGRFSLTAAGQCLILLVLQLVLQIPPVLFGIFSPYAPQYTGASLAAKAMPLMWLLTLAAIGFLVACNRRKLSWTVLLPVVLLPLMIQMFHSLLSGGRGMEQMVYEMDDYYRVVYITFNIQILLVLALTIRIQQGKGRGLLGFSLAGLICAIALTAPSINYVNSSEIVYAYELGETAPRTSFRISIRGVFVERILETDYFDGSWSVEGYTDGWEQITTFSPDDRPYKQVTRYDANGEKIAGADFQLFGNSHFTEYVITVDRLLKDSNPDTDWDPEKGNVLCTDAADLESLIAVSERNHIGNFRSYYGEQVEVNP